MFHKKSMQSGWFDQYMLWYVSLLVLKDMPHYYFHQIKDEVRVLLMMRDMPMGAAKRACRKDKVSL